MVRFTAHFDGKHLRPDEPVNLPTGKPLQVTVEEAPAPTDAGPMGLAAWLDGIEAQAGLVDGPPDWAAEHDHYLYGTPKKSGLDGK